METSVAAIIPARGGSKGIPRKNIALLCKQPLISYAIRAARDAATVGRVFVSTDDAEIGEVSRRYGAEIIRRPAAISGDEASSETALLHALEYLQKNENYSPEIIVFLQCTAPLTTADDIDGVVAALRNEDADCALAVTDFHYFLWRRAVDGSAIGINHDKDCQRLRRQDLEPQYIETGSVYAMRTEGFRETGRRFYGKTVLHVTAPQHCLEIDDAYDLEIAELAMRLSLAKRHADQLEARASKIKLFATDVDGVLTDAGMYYSEKGDELKKFNTRDGMAMALLRATGLITAIITSENTKTVAQRAKKLNVDYLFQGAQDKLVCLEKLVQSLGLTLDEVCYMGDDRNDTKLLSRVGLACCPADAMEEIRSICHIVTEKRGGHGCVREVVDQFWTYRRS